MPLPEPHITRYQRWLRDTRGLSFDRYDALWRWSVDDLPAFWASIWDYLAARRHRVHRGAGTSAMPGARWFPGAQLNYAQHLLSHADAAEYAAGHPAIVFADEARYALLSCARSWSCCSAASVMRAFIWACSGRPRLRHPAQRAADHGGLPGHRQPGRHLVMCRRTWGRWRCSTASARSNPRAGRLRRRWGGGRDHDHRPVAGRAADGAQRAVPWRNLGFADRRRRPAGARLHTPGAGPALGAGRRPSTIRCGWSIPAAPPACPSPSCTATAAACWSAQ